MLRFLDLHRDDFCQLFCSFEWAMLCCFFSCLLLLLLLLLKMTFEYYKVITLEIRLSDSLLSPGLARLFVVVVVVLLFLFVCFGFGSCPFVLRLPKLLFQRLYSLLMHSLKPLLLILCSASVLTEISWNARN